MILRECKQHRELIRNKPGERYVKVCDKCKEKNQKTWLKNLREKKRMAKEKENKFVNEFVLKNHIEDLAEFFNKIHLSSMERQIVVQEYNKMLNLEIQKKTTKELVKGSLGNFGGLFGSK